MLKGKSLILATRKYAKEDRRRSWYYTITTLFMLLVSLGLTISPLNISIRIICSIISGLLMVRMFVIYHDYMHDAILQHAILAKIIFTIYGMYVLAPGYIWRRSHNHHHHHNSKLFSSGVGTYPVYTKSKFEKCNYGERVYYLFIRHPLTILFGYVFTFMYGMCIKPLINNFDRNKDSLFALLFHFGIQGILLLFFGWQEYLLFSIIPHFISSAIGSYLFYVQHNFPGVIFSGDAEWTYEGAAIESSCYIKLNPFLKWITASIGYHHIHHLNSRIPFYRLAEVMDSVEELQHPKTISFSLNDIIACLKLKVWDHENKRMTGTG